MSLSTSCGLPTFGRGNDKLPDTTLTFALPTGFTCPGALTCLAMAQPRPDDPDRYHAVLGPHTIHRCYAVNSELRLPSVRSSRWRNFNLIKDLAAGEMADLLLAGLAAKRQYKSTHVRWFTGGDCFNVELRDAIRTCARRTPDLIHYLYTKNLPIFLDLQLPGNLRVTASLGGKWDALACNFDRTARIVDTIEEAAELGLPIDCDDRLAWQEIPSHFCHLFHGTPVAGSKASKALSARRKAGLFTGYGKSHRQRSAA